MENMLSEQNQTTFEQIKRLDQDKNEYWTARDLSKVLEYSEYRHFKPVIDRAKEACKNSGYEVLHHFEDILDMIDIGKGARRGIDDVKLSRYACYLIVQNADPGKEIVALGQTYFAVQTRLQEVQQMEAYQQLNTEEEKRLFLRKEMAEHNKHLAEAANLFRATQTEEKLKREKIKGKQKANQTHFEVGKKVRKTIQELGGTMPENLPVADNIKKIDKKPELKKITTKRKR
jgi:DNA-damage-inducible protein D